MLFFSNAIISPYVLTQPCSKCYHPASPYRGAWFLSIQPWSRETKLVYVLNYFLILNNIESPVLHIQENNDIEFLSRMFL